MTIKEKVLKDAKSRDYYGEAKVHSDSNILDAYELGEQDKLASVGKVIDELKQEDNINVGDIDPDSSGLIYVENYVDVGELKQKLGIK